ncbi:MAG: coproporphyrinogen-III oxidase family protein [Planctomycetota bacterium]
MASESDTKTGNYFVANYPPFSTWRVEDAHVATDRLARPPAAGTPFGLYVHIPFCRKRCDFCYFRVYTDKNASAVHRYLDAVVDEARRHAEQAAVRGRKPEFVYFGGGTPSYLSVDQLTRLFDGLQQHLPWDGAKEITFECEPGTLQEQKIHALKDMGITRLSLGVENFDPDILERNNRAHRAKEIDRAYGFARQAGFRQINIDLIAGMIGETDDNWRRCIERTLELEPDSVTIYQMEIPFNTTVARRMKDDQQEVAPVADWDTKRRWVDEAFAALERAGYRVGSAYTASRGDQATFEYRDGLWHGADLLGLGVASFGHIGGVHYQNVHDFDPYLERVESGALPVHRALQLTDDQRLIREFILQLKLGSVDTRPFVEKFGVDPLQRFAAPLRKHQDDGYLRVDGPRVELARHGLLQVDRLLHDFFPEEHRAVRYA